MNQNEYRDEEAYWGTLFGVTLELLWRSRNVFVFKQKRHTTHGLHCQIKNQTDWLAACCLKIANLQPRIILQAETGPVAWKPPPRGYWKLNTDGSVKNNGRSAGCGGVLRGSRGEFIFGFSCRLRACSVLEAELQGILHGLRIAWNRGYKSLMVEAYSTEAIDLLSRGGTGDNNTQLIVNEICEIGEADIDVH